MTNKISVLLADDHQMLLELWTYILSRDSRFYVCGSASSGTSAVEIAGHIKPDVVLLDINMAPIDGFETTRLILTISPQSRIIGLSGFALPAYAKKLKALGGMGYVTKCSPVDEMIAAILEVRQGNFYYCNRIQSMIWAEEKMRKSKQETGSQLTQREIEIIRLIKEGLNSRQIAERLDISPKTVHIHRNNIFRKLNVNSAVSLVQIPHLAGI